MTDRDGTDAALACVIVAVDRDLAWELMVAMDAHEGSPRNTQRLTDFNLILSEELGGVGVYDQRPVDRT